MYRFGAKSLMLSKLVPQIVKMLDDQSAPVSFLQCSQRAYNAVIASTTKFDCWGTGIRGLMRGIATFPQGNQDLLVVRDKVGILPGELGVSKSMECGVVARQEGHLACKNLGVGLLVVMI